MVPAWKVNEVRLLLTEDRLSQREIARATEGKPRRGGRHCRRHPARLRRAATAGRASRAADAADWPLPAVRGNGSIPLRRLPERGWLCRGQIGRRADPLTPATRVCN